MRKNPLGYLSRLTVLFILLSTQLYGQPILDYTSYISGLSAPVDIVNAHDGSGRLFIVEQGGRIRIFKDSVRAAPFLDVRSLVTFMDERGLLSVAFHPHFDINRYFFIWYASTTGTITTVHLARYRARLDDPNRADSLSGVVLLSIDKPSGRTNHNGAKLNFGPDGMLYIGTGDGGSGNDPDNLAQNGNVLLGKMLRINVDDFLSAPPYYTIPSDNPFVSTPGMLPEIYNMGLRNPWRWTFDTIANNKNMWIADVGQSAREEVDMLPFASTPGVNYGWRCYEGLISTPGVPDCTPTNYVPPIFDYPHDATGGSAIVGGAVYRGSQYPNLYGYYVTADLSSGNAWTILPNGSGGSFANRQTGFPNGITTFGTNESGELFMAAGSTIYQISGTFPLPLTLQNLQAKSFTTYNEVKWETLTENNTDHFDVEYGFGGRNYQVAGSLKASGNATGSSYVFHHDIQMTQKVFYRLRMVDHDGSGKYSPVVIVSPLNKKMELILYPIVVNNQQFKINSNAAINEVDIFNNTGTMIFHRQIGGASGYFTINLPSLPASSYWVRISGDNEKITKQIIVQ
jgi:glucose/arabinose dehydrogenase